MVHFDRLGIDLNFLNAYDARKKNQNVHVLCPYAFIINIRPNFLICKLYIRPVCYAHVNVITHDHRNIVIFWSVKPCEALLPVTWMN